MKTWQLVHFLICPLLLDHKITRSREKIKWKIKIKALQIRGAVEKNTFLPDIFVYAKIKVSFLHVYKCMLLEQERLRKDDFL